MADELKTIDDLVALDRDDMVDEIEEVISESFDIDWTARVGAERIADYLIKLSKTA